MERMDPELRREGIGGLMIETPPLQKKHVNRAWPKQAAAKIRAATQQQVPGKAEVEGFTVERIASDSEPS